MGGLDPTANLRQASTTYENGTAGIYVPGLRDANVNLNRVWRITSQEIDALIADAADGTIDDIIPVDILEWPAAGAPGLDNIDANRLADFVDTDNDEDCEQQCRNPAATQRVDQYVHSIPQSRFRYRIHGDRMPLFQ